MNKRALKFALSPDPDRELLTHLSGAVTQPAGAAAAPRWQPGRPFRILLSGYFGAGNVGSDMRSAEIVRQLRHLLGAQALQLTALAVTEQRPPDVLGDIAWRLFDDYPPEVMASAVDACDAVVACEGSMFKSTFSDALSAIMAGSLGRAVAQGKPAIGYGGEVAAMQPQLTEYVSAHANEALILCRNPQSLRAAEALGLRGRLGADTAWTLAGAPPTAAAAKLRRLGWNGSDSVLIVCPSNPFWWPVRVSPRMAIERQRTGAHNALWYGSIFFHADSPAITRAYAQYLDGLAAAVSALCRRQSVFPLIVGMERVDETACHDLAARLPWSAPVMMGHRQPVAMVAAILRRADLLISSRFHALVAAMPAAVPSIGIAMDERIRNLFHHEAQQERVIAANDPALGERILQAASRLDRAAVTASAQVTVCEAIRRIADMARDFVAEMQRVVPDLPIRQIGPAWHAPLAPLPHAIEALLADSEIAA